MGPRGLVVSAALSIGDDTMQSTVKQTAQVRYSGKDLRRTFRNNRDHLVPTNGLQHEQRAETLVQRSRSRGVEERSSQSRHLLGGDRDGHGGFLI